MRVGLSYDLLRLSPCSGDLYANLAGIFRKKNSPRTPTQKHQLNYYYSYRQGR